MQSLSDMISHMAWYDWFGYAGMAFGLASMWMATMIPLRMFAIFACAAFGIYSFSHEAWPNFIINMIALPTHIWRLSQMLRLVREVEAAAHGPELSLDWLKPFMSRRTLKAGETLFHKGAKADQMYCVISGALRLAEIGCDLGPGEVVGEIAMFTPGHTRTATAVAVGDVELLAISESSLKQLYYQNPKFGFFLIQLVARRLLANAERLEASIVTNVAPAARAG